MGNLSRYKYVEDNIHFGPCLKGTSISIATIDWEILSRGLSVDEFLNQHGGVDRNILQSYLDACTSEEDDHEYTPVSWDTLSLNDVSICAELVDQNRAGRIAADSLVYDFGGSLQICLEAEHEAGINLISRADLVRWGVSEASVIECACGDPAGVWDWNRNQLSEMDDVTVFEYPDNDTCWIDFVMEPGCLLGHNCVEGHPILFASTPEKPMLTGSADIEGQKLMLRRALEHSENRPLFMHRPIVMTADWSYCNWRVWSDEQNPLADLYRNAFG